MKNEIKCPKCGQVFTVDEADFAAIVQQVKNATFHEEVAEREAQLRKQMKAEQRAEEAQMEASQTAALAKKDAEIAQLKAALNNNEMQIRNARLEEQNKAQRQLSERDNTIARLQHEAQLSEAAQRETERKNKEQMQAIIEIKDAEIERLREFKTSLSTKMIGEELEQWCSDEFNKVRMQMYPNCYFEKDNEVVSGTKGDFIFRNYAEGIEYISIMFEMKNEADLTATKHKNEDFFQRLDENRQKKHCEYAVLVSMLEQDNERWNMGIQDVSYRYDKMFVVRPQFFMAIIALLDKGARASIQAKREAEDAKAFNVDVTNFEGKLADFQSAFNKNVEGAGKHFEAVIRQLDAAIAALEKTKAELTGTMKQLNAANNKAQDLTIRRLTRGNPTVKAMLDAARSVQEQTPEEMD